MLAWNDTNYILFTGFLLAILLNNNESFCIQHTEPDPCLLQYTNENQEEFY